MIRMRQLRQVGTDITLHMHMRDTTVIFCSVYMSPGTYISKLCVVDPHRGISLPLNRSAAVLSKVPEQCHKFANKSCLSPLMIQ